MKTYVYFTYTDDAYWWTHFLKAGFSHCFILIDDGNQFLLIESSYSSVNYRSIPYGSVWEDLPNSLRKQCLVLEILAEPSTDTTLNIFKPFTCVELVKRILGIRNWIVTPYQLYLYLSEEYNGKRT